MPRKTYREKQIEKAFRSASGQELKLLNLHYEINQLQIALTSLTKRLQSIQVDNNEIRQFCGVKHA